VQDCFTLNCAGLAHWQAAPGRAHLFRDACAARRLAASERRIKGRWPGGVEGEGGKRDGNVNWRHTLRGGGSR
jgi:hypothetical protein